MLKLATGGKNLNPAWSPDGKTIAYTHNGYIYLMDAANGSNKRRLSSMPGGEATWSPDGSKIAFWAGDDSSTQIYIIDANGKNLRQLTDGKGYHENPDWSLDGQWIVYWSDETGDREIYLIHPDGSGKINITNSPGADEGPEWSRW
jgi:TolB protein